MRHRFLDTETCGFHGPAVLIQHAIDKGPVNLHHVWHEPIIDTIGLIEDIAQDIVVGFNLTYDWFHICKTYTTLVELGERVGYDEYPLDHIDEYAMCEPKARDGKCVKPASALDLMLYARKGPYQSTMDRRNIRIKKVPRQLAPYLVEELEDRVKLDDIYFSRRKDKKAKKWQIYDIKGEKDFVDVVLKFAPSSALKVLVQHALKKKNVIQFGDIELPKKVFPNEVGWAPFALAIAKPDNGWYCEIKMKGQKRKSYAWPGLIKHHIDHWYYTLRAQDYARLDVKYLQELHEFFGNPEHGDDDSVLTCMVGAVRWRGFAIDHDAVERQWQQADVEEQAAPKAPHHVMHYLGEVMTPEEKLGLTSTKKVILEEMSKLKTDCPHCNAYGCEHCNKTGEAEHPAAPRAKACLKARQARTKKSLFDKLKRAGRLHVSAKVIGALSGRMSGADGLNATGIQHEKIIRELFTLALPDHILCGGDFESYEVSIADARYNDPELRKQLLTCYVCGQTRTVAQFDELYCPHCGAAVDKCADKKCKETIIVYKDRLSLCGKCGKQPKGEPETTMRKIHGLFGQELAPGLTYEDVLATKGKNPDYYDQGKRGIFSQFYGGNYFTLMTRLGIDEETARKAELGFSRRFQEVGRSRALIAEKFCSMRQPKGIGTKVEWHEPADYAESLTGFKRFFTLENTVCRTLFELAEDPPEEWQNLKIEVVRRDRVQKIGGAVRSAVFAAAFAIQSKNMRAAANHEIQSTGAILTKKLQRILWDEQPSGVHDWNLQPFQVHDEINCPCKPEIAPRLQTIVRAFVLEHRSLIPLLNIGWKTGMKSWAEK